MFILNIYDQYEESDIQFLEYCKKDFRKLKAGEDYDCIITPGNAFGIMDGGFDKVVLDKYPLAQEIVQRTIKNFYGSECPVGASILVKLSHKVSLVYAVTMRFPGPLASKDIAYTAALSAFSAIESYNKAMVANLRIKNVAMPLLATTTGGYPPVKSAHQIILALSRVGKKPPKDWSSDALADFRKDLEKSMDFINTRTGK